MLNSGKSGGPDRLLNEFFYSWGCYIAKILKTIFNIIFETGYFPTCLTEGHIVPIHKNGSLGSVENYRDITLLSTL